MKVGEIFTTERIVMGDTGYRYVPVLLTGGAALVENKVILIKEGEVGGPEIQRFSFQFLRSGKAEIQLARFRPFNLKEVIYEEVLPFHVEPANEDSEVKTGGWSAFASLTAEDSKIFDIARMGIIGVEYTPYKVAKQIVHGTNYRFFCYGRIMIPENKEFPAMVNVYAPLPGEGQPIVTTIERVVL